MGSPTQRLYTLPTIWFAGLLLISAGLLKLSYPTAMVFGMPSEIAGALSVCEIVLGLWLLSCINRIQALFFGILAFTGLMVVSGRMVLSGIHDCGCMGSIPTNPWVMFGLDALSAIGLVIALRHCTDRVTFRHGLFRFLASIAGLTVILVAIGVFIGQRYGSLEAAIHNWQGYTLDIPRSVDAIPEGDDGAARAVIPIQNVGNAPLRVVGHDICCGTRLHNQFPITLQPGENETLIITLNCNRNSPLVITFLFESENKTRKQRVVVPCRNRD